MTTLDAQKQKLIALRDEFRGVLEQHKQSKGKDRSALATKRQELRKALTEARDSFKVVQKSSTVVSTSTSTSTSTFVPIVSTARAIIPVMSTSTSTTATNSVSTSFVAVSTASSQKMSSTSTAVSVIAVPTQVVSTSTAVTQTPVISTSTATAMVATTSQFCGSSGFRHASGVYPKISNMPGTAASGSVISVAFSVLMTQFACDFWSMNVDFDPNVLEYVDDATFNPVYYSPMVARSATRVTVSTTGNNNVAATNGNKEILLGNMNFKVKAAPGSYTNVLSACATGIYGRFMITMGTNVRFDFGNGVFLAPLKIV